MTVPSATRVLIVSIRNWLGAARLPKAFQRAGFEVTTATFPSLLLDRCRNTRAQLFLPDSGPEEELIAAMRRMLVAERPNIVVPGDEAAAELLQAVAASARRELPETDPLLMVLRDSLGDFKHHRTLRDRRALGQLAADLGVRTPAQRVIPIALRRSPLPNGMACPWCSKRTVPSRGWAFPSVKTSQGWTLRSRAWRRASPPCFARAFSYKASSRVERRCAR